METRYYSNIAELKEAPNPERANDLLDMGWELLAIRQLVDSQATPAGVTQTVRTIYVLGRHRE